MKTLYTLAFTLALTTASPVALATTVYYAGSGASNIDTNPATVITLNVPDTGLITLLDLSVSIGQPYADDVSIFLFHAGTLVQVYNGVGDTSTSVIDATFSDQAVANYPANGSAVGTFLPFQALSAFNGLEINGDWQLQLLDNVVPGDGTPLLSWSLSGTVDSSVPEPGSMGLMGIGLAALGALRAAFINT